MEKRHLRSTDWWSSRHMNTFLSLTDAKTREQIAAESGYTNVAGHIQALREEGKVESVSLENGRVGYRINATWFRAQPKILQTRFLEAAQNAIGNANLADRDSTSVPKFWCVNFDDEYCLSHGLDAGFWMMQYQYPDTKGNDFQGGDKQAATTKIWKQMCKLRVGDKLIAYLRGSRFFAVGTVVAPRALISKVKTFREVKEYIDGKDSHRIKSGVVVYRDAEALYEDFDDSWRHPRHRFFRYAQRIDVAAWELRFSAGVKVQILGDKQPFELHSAVFEITEQQFQQVADALEEARNGQVPEWNGTPSETYQNDLISLDETLEDKGYFSPDEATDSRVRILTEIVQRRGQSKFRSKLLNAYGRRCAISGCDAEAALEAAHIKPYSGDASDHVTNGLLLRADLHTLFDLGLLRIHPDTFCVHLSNDVRESMYAEFELKKITVPKNPTHCPSQDALRWKWNSFLAE